NALVRLHLAHARAPRDPETLYLLAMARILWRDPDAGGRLEAEDEETLALLEKLRHLDPEYQAARVAFELGILYTRARDFEGAADEYDRCLNRILLTTEGERRYRTPEDVLADRLFGPVPAPTVHYNLGDVTMARGDLPRAIAQYRRAIEEGRRSGRQFRTVLLSHWGLAAALDRFGEHAAALEHAREAVRLDDEPMAVLHLSSVFFEPSYDLHYYEALGHTALANRAAEKRGGEAEDETRSALSAAAASWQQFLSEGGDQSAWADLARKHLDETRARLADEDDR
ncbi:MAG: tetratricopeptide repeat protein, partial [Myxococcota bacterium]